MEIYNYTVGDNSTVRKVKVFIPLRLIFGCCSVEGLLKVVNFEIKLARKSVGEYHELFYGDTGTNIQFD